MLYHVIDILSCFIYNASVKREALIVLSTVNSGSLEGFELFYEDLELPKNTPSRLRRGRIALATD